MQLLVIDGDLSPLIRKLQKGSLVNGRIVQVLNENHYLLRIFGYNLIMKSNVRFKRFEEVIFKVVRTEPKIQLRLFDAGRELLSGGKIHLMDIKV